MEGEEGVGGGEGEGVRGFYEGMGRYLRSEMFISNLARYAFLSNRVKKSGRYKNNKKPPIYRSKHLPSAYFPPPRLSPFSTLFSFFLPSSHKPSIHPSIHANLPPKSQNTQPYHHHLTFPLSLLTLHPINLPKPISNLHPHPHPQISFLPPSTPLHPSDILIIPPSSSRYSSFLLSFLPPTKQKNHSAYSYSYEY